MTELAEIRATLVFGRGEGEKPEGLCAVTRCPLPAETAGRCAGCFAEFLERLGEGPATAEACTAAAMAFRGGA